MNDDYIMGQNESYMPHWLLRALRTSVSPDKAYGILKNQYFVIEGERLLFAKSINDDRGVICSTLCRVIYFQKSLYDGMPAYEETMHNFAATPSLTKKLLSMKADEDYNAIIKLCKNVAAEANLSSLTEQIKQQEDHLQHLIALRQIEINELIKYRFELMVCVAKIGTIAKK